MEIPAGKNNVHLIPVCQLDQDVQVIAGHGQVYAIGDVIRNPVRGGSVVQDDYFSRLYQTGCILCNAAFLLYRKFLLNHELCKQIALQKQGTENRRSRLEDIKTFFSKIVIVDIIKFM